MLTKLLAHLEKGLPSHYVINRVRIGAVIVSIFMIHARVRGVHMCGVERVRSQHDRPKMYHLLKYE